MRECCGHDRRIQLANRYQRHHIRGADCGSQGDRGHRIRQPGLRPCGAGRLSGRTRRRRLPLCAYRKQRSSRGRLFHRQHARIHREGHRAYSGLGAVRALGYRLGAHMATNRRSRMGRQTDNLYESIHGKFLRLVGGGCWGLWTVDRRIHSGLYAYLRV